MLSVGLYCNFKNFCWKNVLLLYSHSWIRFFLGLEEPSPIDQGHNHS